MTLVEKMKGNNFNEEKIKKIKEAFFLRVVILDSNFCIVTPISSYQCGIKWI